ncbi:MAG: VOC family protein [Gaiellales bacterium]
MRLHGIHHVTAITADGPRNAEFYGGVLGLRLVKKTVNFDDPGAYHLYYGDRTGSPGTALTFFEYPGARLGRAGEGMVTRIDWSVPGEDALDWWERWLAGRATVERGTAHLDVWDPEGLVTRLVAVPESAPLPHAEAPHVPAAAALRRMIGVQAQSRDPERSAAALQMLGFERDGGIWWTEADRVGAAYELVPAGDEPSIGGAGTTHHVAWASRDADHEAWLGRAAEAGLPSTPIVDRDYFRSIYFREPSGVLFELATDGPGFAIDEPVESLGTTLRLPRQHEHLRPLLEERLAPIPDPWAPYR